MISFPSRCGAFALVMTAGFLSSVNAQTSAPALEMVHTNSQGRHIAPPDTFYTTEYVSVTTDKGVIGFPPGTEVHLVSVNNEANTLTVSDGKANVDVSPGKLTNDMDIAGMVRAKDDAKQAQIAAYQQASAKAYQDYQKEVAEYTAKDLEKRQQANRDSQQKPLPPTVSQPVEQVNASAYNNGYYNEGGYGFGSPYYYFTKGYVNRIQNNSSDAGRTVTGTSGTAAGRGTLPSNQTAAQSSGKQSATTNGATTSGGQSAGGKKP